MKILEKSINILLNTKPFYAHLFLNSRIVYDQKGIETAGAGVDRNGTILYFNRKFIESMTEDQLAGIIEHEVLHLVFNHVETFKDKTVNKTLANISMDCAINQYIPVLPPGGITFDELNKMCKGKLERLQTWRYYYEQLLLSGVKVTYVFDDHPDAVAGAETMTPDEYKQMLAHTMSEAAKASKGNIPGEVKTILNELTKPAQLNWKQVLANFVARSTSNITLNTRKKMNRRYGINVPGKKQKRELTLGVCVDSSGSISDSDYEQFMAEISRIGKFISQMHIIEADCIVQNTQKVKKNAKFKASRTGFGGTAYQPAITECVRLRCEAIVYFGDFDTSDTPQNPGIPFLWVGVGSSPKPANFGFETRLK